MELVCKRCEHELSAHYSAIGSCNVEECTCEMYLHEENNSVVPIAPTQYDIIDNPEHYTNSRIETWDFIVDKNLPYLLGHVVRYVVRAGRKDPSKYVEDLEKARAYLDREIERAETGM